MSSNNSNSGSSNSNSNFKRYAIIGAVGVAAVAVILLALGAAQAPAIPSSTPGSSQERLPGEIPYEPEKTPTPGAGSADTVEQPIPDVAPTASVAVGPNPARPGDTVTVSGDGFGRNQQVTITLGNSVVETEPPTVMTDGTGKFSAQVTLPEDAQQGEEYNVTAADQANRAATITVLIR